MAQFTAYQNVNPATKTAIPYLLNVQNDLIEDLGTRVVVPLYPAAAMQGKTLKTLTPMVEIEGKSYAMMTPQLAGVPRKSLGAAVADLSSQRHEIIAALDLLITGI
ncbi:MAG: CcdB family protein [Betaproteobacteria bacterium]|nr:CcdB family protein [Betaproteobacteria bacterium]